MGKFFDLDSPLMSGLNKMADLMILNFLTILLCIPVVTAGASITAMHYVCLKLVRNEETYIIKQFFKSFKQNFVQATAIWFIKLAIAVLLYIDFRIALTSENELPFAVIVGLFAVTVLVFALGLHAFALLAKFENSIFATIKNSVLVGLLIFPKTILMVLIWAVPLVIAYAAPAAWSVLVLFGFSLPGFTMALLYNKTFKKFEPQVEEKDADDWVVEPVEALEDYKEDLSSANEMREDISDLKEQENGEN